MKQVCILCERSSSGGNLWCLESYCSVDNKPFVLDYGETLGELTIDKTVAVLRASTLYEAERNGERVLLKVAHPGFQERLKREATFLAGVSHPMLPTVLPAYGQADATAYPYGKTVLQGRTLYYSVFEALQGDLLRGWLLKNPQPWFQHAGWIAIGLCEVLGVMHQNNRLHLCLSPEIVMVRFDLDMTPRVTLLDLGAVAEPKLVAQHWRSEFVPTAYVAPELIRPNNRRVGTFSDVYGVGLMLYEMLAGVPAHNYRLRADEMIRNDVLNSPIKPLSRPDLTGIPDITMQAVDKTYKNRQKEIVALASQLLGIFPPLPKEREERKFNWRTFTIVVASLMAIMLLVILAAAIGETALGITGTG